MQPVKWGVLGVSNHSIKRVLPPMIKSGELELYAIASRNPDKARQAAEKYAIPRYHVSYEELLADAQVEVVYIPLPNHIHLEWIRKAADAGKHIVCEKPLTLNAGDTLDAIKSAEKKGVLLMEALMYRFHPQWKRVVELVNNRVIGDVHAVHALFCYSNTDPANIRNQLKLGGGALYDIGCYAVSSARFIFGREPIRGTILASRDKRFGTDTLTSGCLDFGIGRAVFTVGTQTFPYQRVDIFGSKGRIAIPVPFDVPPRVRAVIEVVSSEGSHVESLDPVDPYGIEMDVFSRAVRNGGESLIPNSDALGNARTLDALFQSERSGRWEGPVY